MKVLLSAYACEPNRGSEQGVGWGWATELAKNNEVWVLTRDRNQTRIEQYLREHPQYLLPSLHFIYVGLPKNVTFWKKGNRGIRLYYMIWQKAAYKKAKKLHEMIGFDYVQHVTFVSYTQPTYMYKLGIPMIWGPVSGGENIPEQIKIEMTAKEHLIERVRTLSQGISLWCPSVKNTLHKCTLILAATEETKNKIPNKYHNKTFIVPAIGLESIPQLCKTRNAGKIRIIMAGRLIYWKAFDIGIKAFLSIADRYPQSELYVLGEGSKKKSLMKLTGKYLNKQVFFCEPVPHDTIYKFYSDFDIFLNTTLRDSGCMTMMEAMAVGLPCIALDTGGPAVLAKYGKVFTVLVESYETTVKAVAEKLTQVMDGVASFEDEGRLISIAYEAKINEVKELLTSQLKM